MVLGLEAKEQDGKVFPDLKRGYTGTGILDLWHFFSFKRQCAQLTWKISYTASSLNTDTG